MKQRRFFNFRAYSFPSFIGQPFRGRGHLTASHVVSRPSLSRNIRLAINLKIGLNKLGADYFDDLRGAPGWFQLIRSS